MIDIVPLLKIAPLFAVGLIIPGPDFFMVSSITFSRGRLAGIQAGVGIAACSLVWIVLCMFGLGLVFAKLQALMIFIRFCGGLYLIYLGYQLWKSSFKSVKANDQTDGLGNHNRRHPLVIGFITNLTNPKVMAFFTSIFALILPKEVNLETQVAVTAMMGLMSFGWFSFVSFCLSAPAMRTLYMRWSHWIDRVAGTFLAFFGTRLLFSFRN